MAERPTHCPNCGLALPEQPLSLCAYCAMPIGLEGSAPTGESPNAERIQRVLAHDSFDQALEWEPPESPLELEARREHYRGRLLIVAALVIGVAGRLLARGEGGFLRPSLFVAVVLALFGAWRIVCGVRLRREATAQPLLKRAGMITDRRSETVVHGLSGHTTYFFEIEFEGGVVGEFAYPGRGAHEDPYVKNLPGVAYSRGASLLAFKHVRV